MDQSKKRADGSQLSSLSHSIKASIYQAEIPKQGSSAENFSFMEHFLFPFIAETNRTSKESGLLNLAMSGILILQVLFSTYFDVTRENVPKAVAIINQILYAGLDNNHDHRLTFYIVTTVLDVVFILIFLYTYISFKITFEFKKFSKFLMKFLLGNCLNYLLIPNFCFCFASLSEIGIDPSAENIVFFIVGVILTLCIYLLFTYVTIPLILSPYINPSNYYLWSPNYILHCVIVYGIALSLSIFFENFDDWYQVIPPIISIIGSVAVIYSGIILHQKVKIYNALYMDIGVCFIVSSLLSIVSVFTDIDDLLRYLIPIACLILANAVTIPFTNSKRNKIIEQLSYQAIVDHDLTTEEAKTDYFDTFEINSYNKAFTYLNIGLEEASPLFLDFSLIRYLIKKFPEDNALLISEAWFVSFFPNEQMTMHSLITLVNKMIKPTHFQRIMRYQLHRVHIFRQSSASKEANADLNKVKQLTDSVINENCKFWSNAALPHTDLKEDFHLKLTSIRQKAEAGWAEVIDKYPNNARFATEYSRFLIEAVCNFKDGVKWYHRALKIESGRRRQTDRLFKALVVSFPFYLKKGIVGMNGDIRIKKVMQNADGTNQSIDSTNPTNSTNSSSRGLSSTGHTSQDSEESSAFDMAESEKALPQSSLRLAFETAVKSMKSKVIINTTVSALLKLFVCVIMSILLIVFIYPVFDLTSFIFTHYTSINRVEHLTTIVADQAFWYIVDGLQPFVPDTIKGYFGPRFYETPTFTNIFLPTQSGTVANLTAYLNNIVDMMSQDMYLNGEVSSEIEQILVDLVAFNPQNQVTCSGDTTNGYTATIKEGGETFDGLVRSFIITGSKITMPNADQIAVPYLGTGLLNTQYFCEFYHNYILLQDAFDDFTHNRSTLYSRELNHYLNTPGATSIYMGDAETNYSPEELDELEANPDNIIIDETVADLSDLFIAIIPFVILLFAMPSIIFLTSVLSSETKQYTSILLSFPPDVCVEASGRIQKNVIKNDKSSGFMSTASGGNSFPYFLITLIDSIIIIAILLIAAAYVQTVDTKLNTLSVHFVLFMEERNSMMFSGLLMQYRILLRLIENGKITLAPADTKLPYLDLNQVEELYNYSKTRTSMLQGIIDIGDDSFDSALGISDDIDSARFDPLCEQIADTEYALDFYKCLSFDRACSYFSARLAEMEIGLSELTLDSKDMYNFAFLVNSRLMLGFDNLMNTIADTFYSTLNNFQIAVIILCVIAIVLAVISFFIELGSLTSIKQMFTSIHTVMLRLNPIHFVQNQAAVAFLVGKNNSEETHITSAAHAVFYTSTDAMILLNNDGIIEKLNPATTSIFHFTPEQMLGQHSTIIIPKDSQKNQQLYYTMQLMASGQCGLVFETELEGVRDDGVIVPIKATMIGFSSNQRNAEIFAIMCKDQTEEMKQKEAVEIAKKKSDELLLKILPPDIIRRINRGEKDITMVVPSASVIFIDICQFSAYMATLSASQLMSNLNAVFTAYDKIVADLPLITKIKLIGDDYMAAAGLFSPDEPPKMHAIQTITFGLRVLDAIEELNEQLNASLAVRIGVNSGGPIIAGVLGTEKPLFDIIGDTINVASRLQSTCIPGNVQISKGTYELVAQETRFHIEERGEIYLKGKGNQTTYLVSQQGREIRRSYKDINLPPAIQKEAQQIQQEQQAQQQAPQPEPQQQEQKPESPKQKPESPKQKESDKNDKKPESPKQKEEDLIDVNPIQQK